MTSLLTAAVQSRRDGGLSPPRGPGATSLPPCGKRGPHSKRSDPSHPQDGLEIRPTRRAKEGPMDLRNLALGGAALGILTACWDYLKSFAWRLIGLFVRRIEIPSEAAHQALIAYLVANHPRWRNYDTMYGADFEHMRDG